MFARIYLTELKRNVWNISFPVYFLIFFSMTYLFAANRDPDSVFLMVQLGKEFHNAPVIIGRSIGVLSAFGILVTMVMAGRCVARDFITGTHHFYFSAPLKKNSFLGGRFLGSLTANLLVFGGALLGYAAGCLAAGPEFYGPFRADAFIMPILFVVIPNILLAGSLMFAMATITRRMVATYVAGVALLTLYFSVTGALTQVDNDLLRILADPFASGALSVISRNWTIADINRNGLPLTGAFLLNRALWITVSAAALGLTWHKFRFHSKLEEKRCRTGKNQKHVSARPPASAPAAAVDSSLRAQWGKVFHIVRREARQILLHPAFIILAMMSVGTVLMNFLLNVAVTGSRVYPFTSWYLARVTEMGWVFFIPITILFGGLIIWKERDTRSQGFYDTMPMPDWMSMISKFLTLTAVQFVYVVLLAAAGIFTQVVVLGFTDIEPGLYICQLFGMEWLLYIHMAIIVITIQNLVPGKIAGFFVSSVVFIGDIILFSFLRVDLPFIRYGHLPRIVYSNMNGFGHYSTLIFWYTLLWILLGAILLWLNGLVWRRDNELSLGFRFRRAKQLWSRTHSLGLGILIIMFLAAGAFIAVNRYVINPYLSTGSIRQMRADYERKYSRYEHMPQPDITHIDVQVDFYPEQRDVFIRGSYHMVNNTDEPVETIIVNLAEGRVSAVNRLDLSRPSVLAEHGHEFGFRRFRLADPLMPGDSVHLNFDLDVVTKGFTDNNTRKELAYNGSHLNLSMFEPPWYFPSIGYNSEYRLRGKYIREKYGLADLPPTPSLDNAGTAGPFVSSRLVTYDAVISTDMEQVPFSNGDLIEERQEKGRRYCRFTVEQPHSLEFILASGKYAVREDKWRDKSIFVYYYPKHDFNIDRIIQGVKAGLQYGTEFYQPYPHKTVRVIELPDYMNVGGARSFSSAMAWRESAGFITRPHENEVDNIVRIAAHEMAHHWWACTVVPADVEGFYLLSESLADYTAAMALERTRGKKMALRLIDDEMSTYLSRRKRDLRGERPLYRTLAGQAYLGYQKGLCVFYAMQEYIGERNLNRALQSIVHTYSGNTSHYPTSLDLIAEIRKEVPDSLSSIVDDWFTRITLYDCRAGKAVCRQLDHGRYEVDFSVSFHKFYSDSIGLETETVADDYVPIGIMNENEEPLYYELRKINEHEKSFRIIVGEKPVYAGIDPFGILIDKDRKNNRTVVKEAR